MEVTLKIIQVLTAQEGTDRNGNPWKCQGYVGETIDTNYPRKVHFEIFGVDRINQNPCDIDDVVDVHFDIESREYPEGSGKWFTSIRAWRVNPHVAAAQPVAEKKPAAAPVPAPEVPGAKEASSKLPWEK